MPCRSDIARVDRQNDTVIGSGIRKAQSTIGTEHLHALKTCRGEMDACALYNVFVDVDGDNMSRFTYDVCHQCCVIARPRANFQHMLPLMQVQLFQHDRHNRRL